MSGRALFLDIDGCLNWVHTKSICVVDGFAYWGIDTIRVKRLAQIVNATDAKIVLTSDWGQNYIIGAYKQENKCCKYLSNKLREQGLKVYDKIDWTHFKRSQRGSAILDWLQKHPKVTNYVIIDDETFYRYEKPEIEEHLIYCFDDVDGHDELSGLTDKLVVHAINILKGKEKGCCVDEDAKAYFHRKFKF